MYLAHFNFKERPFALSTDPRFLWIGANQRQALATLRYGLEENRGLVLLGGEFGVVKPPWSTRLPKNSMTMCSLRGCRNPDRRGPIFSRI